MSNPEDPSYDPGEMCLLLSDREAEGFSEAFREAFGIEPECE